MFCLGRKVEVNVVLRCDRHAVKGGWLITPLPQRSHDLFIDAIADGLYDSRLHDITVRVDGDLDDHVTLQIAR